MNRHTSTYADTCSVHNTDSEKTVTAEILDFKPQSVLICSINRSVKVTMHYDAKTKIYVGNMAGMEFTSNGPEEINSTYTRRR